VIRSSLANPDRLEQSELGDADGEATATMRHSSGVPPRRPITSIGSCSAGRTTSTSCIVTDSTTLGPKLPESLTRCRSRPVPSERSNSAASTIGERVPPSGSSPASCSTTSAMKLEVFAWP
jgi:hypothetical protein